jgi:formate hydrogenlyase subunit 6/NADH:ubiquinone oxidoreductase subunit I
MNNPLNLPMAARSLHNLVSRPATRRYPSEVRAPYADTRGTLEFDPGTCVFCGLCVRRCPAAALTVSREERFFAIEQLRCLACGACVDACNKDSLHLSVARPQVYLSTDSAVGERRPGHQEWRLGPPTAARPEPAGAKGALVASETPA